MSELRGLPDRAFRSFPRRCRCNPAGGGAWWRSTSALGHTGRRLSAGAAWIILKRHGSEAPRLIGKDYVASNPFVLDSNGPAIPEKAHPRGRSSEVALLPRDRIPPMIPEKRPNPIQPKAMRVRFPSAMPVVILA